MKPPEMLLDKSPPQKSGADGEGSSGKGPLVWILLRVFCLLMLATQGIFAAYLITLMMDPELAEKGITRQPDRAGAARFAFAVLAAIFGLPILPAIFALFCPRSRLGWYLGAVTLWAGIFTTCGWPIAIPLVVFWFHPDVKKYSGLATGEKPY